MCVYFELLRNVCLYVHISGALKDEGHSGVCVQHAALCVAVVHARVYMALYCY